MGYPIGEVRHRAGWLALEARGDGVQITVTYDDNSEPVFIKVQGQNVYELISELTNYIRFYGDEPLTPPPLPSAPSSEPTP